jgi:hypothetical protein
VLGEQQVDCLALQFAHRLVLIDGQTLQLPPCLDIELGERGLVALGNDPLPAFAGCFAIRGLPLKGPCLGTVY